jgi:hypothetical protein
MKGLLVALAAILLLLKLFWRPQAPTPAAGPLEKPAHPQPPSPPAPSSPPPAAPAAPTPPPPPAASPAEIQRALDAIDHLGFTFRDHAAALGGNPVGTNAEITAALLGDNAKQLKLPLPEGSTLNSAGELCDPWGSPWFFHQLSGTRMEIRSAGPDRKLYSADDLLR